MRAGSSWRICSVTTPSLPTPGISPPGSPAPHATPGIAPSKALLEARRALAQSSPSPEPATPRSSIEEALEGPPLDAVFLATPVGVSLSVVPRFVSGGTRVIDLSGAFRLPTAATFEAWYGTPHSCPELLKEA